MFTGAPSVVPEGVSVPSVRRPVWSYRWWALSMSVVAGLCIAHVMRPDGLPGRSTYLLVTVGTAVAAWFGVRRLPAQRQFPWRCVAAAVSLEVAVKDGWSFSIQPFTATHPWADTVIESGDTNSPIEARVTLTLEHMPDA